MKKVLCLLLTLALLCVCFAGCGSNAEVAEAEQETAPAEVAETPAEKTAEPDAEAESEVVEEPVEPSYFPLDEPAVLSYFDSSATAILPYVEDYKNSLEWWQELTARTNVTIEWVHYPSDECTTQLMLSIAANETCDLLNIFTSYTGGLSAALDDGVIYDLAPYMDTYLADFGAACEAEEKYHISAYSSDGTVPQVCHFYSTDRGPDRGMIMRGDWLDEIGVSPDDIVTYDDWYNVLTQFKVTLGASDPCWLSFYGSPMHSCLAAGYGIAVDCFFFSDPYINRDGTATYTPLLPEFLDYMNMMQKWYSEGLLYRDYVNGAIAFNDSEMLSQGKVGAFMQYAVNMQSFNDYMTDDEDYYLVGVANPRLNAGDTLHISPPQEVYESEGVCVSTNCEDIELAMRWLNYFWTEEGHSFANYGVEGVSFEYVDGVPTLLDCVTKDVNSIGIYRYTAGNKLFSGIEQFSRTFSSMNEQQLLGLDRWAENCTGDWNWPDNATLSADESIAYSTAWNDIYTLTAEFINRYIVGEYTEDDYYAFCEQVNSMGIEDCVAIKQAALDRYLNK